MITRALFLLVGLSFSASHGAPLQAPEPRIVSYKEVSGERLKAHIFEPPASAPSPRAAILLFHGGGWNSGDATWVYTAARRFANLGMVAIAIDYRLSDEKAVTPLDAVEDARDAIHWARTQSRSLGIDSGRIAAYGVSAGGHLAAAAALIGRNPGEGPQALDRPDALVLYSPAVAITQSGWVRKLLLGRAKPEDLSPDAFVAPGAPPSCINQGTEDTLTPFVPALLFSRSLRAAGNVCELNRFSGLGHLLSRKLDEQEWQFDPDPVARADAWRAEEAFLARQGFLPPQPKAAPSPESVVRALTEAFNARQMDTLLDFVAKDVHWQMSTGDQFHLQAKGREALGKALTVTLRQRPMLQRGLHMLATNGDFVSVRQRDVWTGSNGETRSQNAFMVYEVKNGKLIRAWQYPAQD
ncbi:alpha/beta hydrolase fold domain-containing protein [Geothrix sp. PMB-07]|uniref:alpha/beta hydrolase fold domain-containing protein n=1 Tax=Geothrix sp. PMB-07 TaxID=3068640 RepID=UPI0027421369|nr:alpha/beta hydrolase fold domain-containing protein [Geothrix sp. PMB-07]WLT32256.1 alpha/beta hydrolase fold domain-containing protein [Geothrix sp. PMB-07]